MIKNYGDYYFAPFVSNANGEYRKKENKTNIQSTSQSQNDANIQFSILCVRARTTIILFKIMWPCFVIKMYISDVYHFEAFGMFSFQFSKKKAWPKPMMKFYFYE